MATTSPRRKNATLLSVMVDATVLFAGTGWPRWSYEVLRHAVVGDFHLVLSPLLIQQARTNLLRKRPDKVEAFDTWLKTQQFELTPDPTYEEVLAHKTLVRQIEDVPVALAAINAQVNYFVSEDKDFTSQDATTEDLRRQLTIMRPVIFLREVMGWSSEELEKVRSRQAWPV